MSLGIVATGAAAAAIGAHVPDLVAERFASRLFAQDATLWGPDAESEASIRLAWVGLPRRSRPLIGEIEALRSELNGRGLDHVALCGMGGSSLAPEVICGTRGVALTVLDSSDPDQVRAALADRLERTIVVVSSKSGSTVETDSQRRAYEAALSEAGLDPKAHLVIVTDPGSPLDKSARADGYRVVNADPNVGGRYSALTAFGLVPSGLAGVDVAELLAEAEVVADELASDDDFNHGLRLGAVMGGTSPLRDKLVLLDEGSGLVGFAAWAEQLIAESTGKQGHGVLPVVVENASAFEVASHPDDVLLARLVAADDEPVLDETALDDSATVWVSGSLGGQLLLWEVATAVAGRLIGINPFDQPDVESAKIAARAVLDAPPTEAAYLFTDGVISVNALGPAWLAPGQTSVSQALEALLGQLGSDGYLAVSAYLDRLEQASLEQARGALASRTQRPVTFGWGPRFLHSTGQLHKGGPPVGVFLQVTGTPSQDLPIPGRPFGFATLIQAQAAGDAAVLAEHGRPVLHLHLRDRQAGMAQLLALLGA